MSDRSGQVHLKGKYGGNLLIATCLDENNQMYPITIGIVDLENNAFWEWFVMRLHEVIGDMQELVFISNYCTSIHKAVYKVFPTALYGLCFYHLESNLKSHFKNFRKLWKYSFRATFLQTVKMYDPVENEKQMEGL